MGERCEVAVQARLDEVSEWREKAEMNELEARKLRELLEQHRMEKDEVSLANGLVHLAIHLIVRKRDPTSYRIPHMTRSHRFLRTLHTR